MALRRLALLCFVLCSTSSLARVSIPSKDLRAGKFYGLLGVQSWQDTMTLTSPTNEVNTLYTSSFGFGLGGGILIYLGDTFVLDVQAGVFTAQSDAGLPSTLPNQLLYSARNLRTFGGNAGVGILWASSDREVYLGPSVLLLAKSTPWPQPGAGYQLATDRSLAVGAVLDCRVEKGSWLVNPKAGFLNSFSLFYWSLAVGYSN